MSDDIIIAAVGDLLMKPLLIRYMRTGDKRDGSLDKAHGSYAFEQAFEPVSKVLQDAHLTIGNLETTFAGGPKEGFIKTRRNPRNGNPVFKCPDSFAPALKRIGFNVLSTANNHCMDYGVGGLKRTLHVLDKNGIAHAGTYRDENESRRLCIRNVRGVRIGILSYTRDTNGIAVPKGQPAGVKLIARRQIRQDLARLRGLSDFIIVCMHFGFEYHGSPASHQRKLVRFLFRQGADVILGAHPHVLQHSVSRTVKDVTGRTRKRFAIYSLGNFISTRLHNKDAALTGMIVRLRIRKTSGGGALLAGIEHIPTWVYISKDSNRGICRVLPLKQAIKKPESYFAGQITRMKRAYRKTTRMYKGVL
ncbi:CapA family protein [Paenibacillus sp. N4]|uniref:CapA family protein n=1 Tax=Paenibacillus vietnamensis TaxID=2590547 RepID=UPI001CD07D76|nr:CapA family protein [Paenibacillus vietnamensis]MCA0756865.1 CapA family protein [Paenibacillus vietnamensis]